MVAGDTEEGNLSFFNKAVAKVMSKARTQDSTCDLHPTAPDFPTAGPNSVPVLPMLLQDIIDKAGKWGNGGRTGRIDPFTEVYNVGLPIFRPSEFRNRY